MEARMHTGTLLSIYASEADVLNMALFGKTAAQWRGENPEILMNRKNVAFVLFYLGFL